MSDTIRNSSKTSRPTKRGYRRPWYLFDASNKPVGRLATEVSRILTGKNRADYSPDVDMGGMVIIINAKDSVLTGKKPQKKNYFNYSGRLGGMKVRSFEEVIKKDPSRPLYRAIKGMLPKNRHQDLRLNNRLFIFPENHNLPVKKFENVNN